MILITNLEVETFIQWKVIIESGGKQQVGGDCRAATSKDTGNHKKKTQKKL